MIIDFYYFKESGKYYTEGTLKIDEKIISGLIYPREIGKKINELCLLPGLSNGTWNNDFVCHPRELYPEIVKM